MHATINELSGKVTAQSEATGQGGGTGDYTPAVSVRKSLASKDHIISMIDGKPYKTLRLHRSGHGLTAKQYRQRYNLKPDYPIGAEGYSEVRRAMAHRIGLGARGRKGPSEPGAEPEAKPKRARKAPAKSAD